MNIATWIMANKEIAVILIALLGSLTNWVRLAYRKETSWNPLDYYLKDAPGHSFGTIGALATSIGALVYSDTLSDVNSAKALFLMSWLLGIGVDATFNITGKQKDESAARKADAAASAQNGFIRLGMLPLLAALALCVPLLTACPGGTGTAAVRTQHDAQALSYYGLGQAQQQLNGAYTRGEVTKSQATALYYQLNLSSAILDITREPGSITAQTALRQTAYTLDSLGVLQPEEMARVEGILAIVTAGKVPTSNDLASWLLYGSDLLRGVTAALPAPK